PAKPTTPETPAKPTTPVTPAKPTTPETPAKPTTPVTPAKPTTPVTPAKPTTPSQPTPSAAVGGNAMTSTNASYNTAKYVTPQGEMNASVTIDGRKIDLSKANAAFLFYREIGPTKDNMSTRMTVLSGRKYSHVQFGAQTVGIISPTYQTTLHHDSFAIGSITPTSGAGAMPTSGKASYVGDAILLQGAAYTTGASKFDVDFGRKTISGLIDHVYDIPVSGKISGSSFSGEQDGIRMKGNFFGPKAAELGGVFSAEHENNVYQGSFGAKKQ
ncbi:transferrin-binding protein-like solute binding protein, partial [Neisseria sp. P0015.S002]|uniref:transferrin-binding protein-like solute binding protein n=1 Tax=Neisseria sp. P0015.S002 TaxID=3436758 RepID=UPI003F7FD6AB